MPAPFCRMVRTVVSGRLEEVLMTMANEVLRDSHGFTAREATIVADDILLLLEENFDAGVEELKKASPLSRRIVYSYFEGELPEAYRVFNPRLVARVEKLSKKFNEHIGSRSLVERNQK
jgi:hypothetical protein